MVIVGELSLWIALLLALWCSIVSFVGDIARRHDLVRSGARAAHAAFAFTALAAIGVVQALVQRDFSYAYVAGHITANMPDVYVLAALWAGSSGATLLWALFLAASASAAVRFMGRRFPDSAPIATTVLGALLSFALAIIAFDANPFERTTFVPADGAGMNPELQNPGMLVHPPFLMAGLALAAVPFALGMGVLRRGLIPDEWMDVARRWLNATRLLLTAGILSGMWWAYVEPRWDGFWAWDPVQAVALLPWLACTAALHFFGLIDRRRMLARWIPALATLPFILAVLAGVVARGAVAETIHDFARSSVGTWFAALLVIVSITAAFLATRPVRAPTQAVGIVPGPSRAKRRPVATYLAYAGMVLLLVAFTGTAFSRTYDVRLMAGQSYDARDPFGREWRFVSQGISRSQYRNSEVLSLTLDMQRGGRSVALITTEKRQYVDSQGKPIFEPSTESGIRTGARVDTYVVLGDVNDEVATVRITFNPLVMWLWVGGALLIVAGAIPLWPRPLPEAAA